MSEIDENFVKQEKENKGSYYDDYFYKIIPQTPTQTFFNGIQFDFNYGFRIYFPPSYENYSMICTNAETGLNFFENNVKNDSNLVVPFKYFINYSIKIINNETNEVVVDYRFNLNNQNVLLYFPVFTIGDSIAWFSYIEKFQKKHNCNVYICMNKNVEAILINQYPEFNFIDESEINQYQFYATYYLGLYMNDIKNFMPVNYKYMGLHEVAGMILGLRDKEELQEIPPKLDLSAKRKIKEKYVVIATHATTQCKHWNNPLGWYEVINFLKENGYKVICIDKFPVNGNGICFNHIPWGVEDYTGDLPLQERINIIKDADFFIGLPSGLSWLAWACKIPIVLISGFSLPYTEFYTPYRVINYNVCHGCWNDVQENFENNNFLWCPRKEKDNEKFECTKYITSSQVINMIKKIPSFNNQ